MSRRGVRRRVLVAGVEGLPMSFLTFAYSSRGPAVVGLDDEPAGRRPGELLVEGARVVGGDVAFLVEKWGLERSALPSRFFEGIRLLLLAGFAFLFPVVFPAMASAQLPTSERESVQSALDDYAAAVAAARDAFVERLDACKVEALADDDLEDVEAIVELKTDAANHSAAVFWEPFGIWRRRLEGTRWRRDGGRVAVFPADAGGWVCVDENRVAQYVEKSQNIYVWIFDADLERGILRRFRPDPAWTVESVRRLQPAEESGRAGE